MYLTNLNNIGTSIVILKSEVLISLLRVKVRVTDNTAELAEKKCKITIC